MATKKKAKTQRAATPPSDSRSVFIHLPDEEKRRIVREARERSKTVPRKKGPLLISDTATGSGTISFAMPKPPPKRGKRRGGSIP